MSAHVHIDDKGDEHVIHLPLKTGGSGYVQFFNTNTCRYMIDTLEDSELFCLDKHSLKVV
jgi:hypothetical protein